jgi:hypothetical protein
MIFRILALSAALVLPAAALEFVSEARLPRGSAEILTYDPATKLIFSTRGSIGFSGAIALSLADPYKPRITGQVDLRRTHPHGVKSIASVAVDPLGRGILVAAILPKDPTVHRGNISFICTRTLTVLHTLETGWHPDCVNFSKDGRFLLIACEGEYAKRKTNNPGSLGVVDLKGIRTAAEVTRLKMEDYPLGPRQLGPGIRIPYETDPARKHLDFEPEYVTSDGTYAWVSLQENNALGVFDLRSRKWSAVRSFGAWPLRMDASDRDGPWGRREIKVSDQVHALPMPDTIAHLKVGGRTLIFTANEGDGDNISRVKHLGNGSPPLCPAYRARLKEIYGIDPQNDSALGRLQVSAVDGVNARGHIEKLHALGTRSFSIWDASNGRRVHDSGSFFEDHAAASDPKSFNHNSGRLSEWDRRSDNRGPETEALTVGFTRGKAMLFIANERQNGLYAFDVSHPEKPRLTGYYNGSQHRHNSPECILLLPKDATPLGRELIITGWEASYSITIHIPKP